MPPRVEHAKCVACGQCLFQCGKNVLAMLHEREEVYPVQAKDCIDCFVCFLVCPHKAIAINLK